MASRAGPAASSSGSRNSVSLPTPPQPSHPRPSAASSAPTVTAKSTADPILRNALRYTISAREYAALHKYVISRSRVLKRRAPSVDAVQRMMDGEPAGTASGEKGKKGKGKGKQEEMVTKAPGKGGADDYNARAIRHSIRVFVATGAAMKLWELVAARLAGKKKE